MSELLDTREAARLYGHGRTKFLRDMRLGGLEPVVRKVDSGAGFRITKHYWSPEGVKRVRQTLLTAKGRGVTLGRTNGG